jgi:hypothetical protein
VFIGPASNLFDWWSWNQPTVSLLKHIGISHCLTCAYAVSRGSRPIAVTLISSYYSLTLPADHSIPDLSHTVIALDLLFSFLGVPIMVVWFWRGSWLLLDYYLYGFSPNSHDVHFSILWSSIVGVSFLIVCSETIFAYIRVRNTVVLLLLGRLRTFILAWGTVNFWRAVWYIWDEFLGGSTQWSCWLAHAASIALLTSFGCMSCILGKSRHLLSARCI